MDLGSVLVSSHFSFFFVPSSRAWCPLIRHCQVVIPVFLGLVGMVHFNGVPQIVPQYALFNERVVA